MSSAVAGYKQSLGADAPPCVLRGHRRRRPASSSPARNTAFAHPILFQRIEDARATTTLIVVSTRARTDTARAADLHLQIAPGTRRRAVQRACCTSCCAKDGAIVEYIRRAHREFRARACDTGRPSDCGRDLRHCRREDRRGGAPVRDVAARRSRSTARDSTSRRAAPAKNCALINLHLATGQIGKPGAGPFSLTGQPNAMGGREVGGMANLLSAHRDLSNPEHREEVAALWGVRSVPARPGKTAVEMFEAIGRGEIKAVWIACTNPAQSMPDANAVREALERAELVVVQDAFRDTETCGLRRRAAAGGRLGGEGRHRHQLRAAHLARARGGAAAGRSASRTGGSRWTSPAKLSHGGQRCFPYQKPGRDLQRAPRNHARARPGHHRPVLCAPRERGPQQWPFPAGRGGRQQAALRGRRVPDAFRPRALRADAVSRPWPRTPTRISAAAHHRPPARPVAQHDPHRDHLSAFAHEPEPRVMMHPEDLAKLALKQGELVRITSRRGELFVSGGSRRGPPARARCFSRCTGAGASRRSRRQCTHHRRARSGLAPAGAEALRRAHRGRAPAMAAGGVGTGGECMRADAGARAGYARRALRATDARPAPASGCRSRRKSPSARKS